MDNRLYGKTILVGKEAQQSRLLIAININGKYYMAPYGNAGSVDNGVSRCIPDMQKGHCLINIDAMGNMTVQNLKEMNVTFVNGMQIMKKAVKVNDIIEMGKFHYKVALSLIIDVATKILLQVCGAPAQQQVAPAAAPQAAQLGAKAPAQKAVKTYDLRPLERVWNNYHDAQQALRVRQKNLQLFSGLTPIFTLLSGALRFLDLGETFANIALVLFVIGLVVTVWAFYARFTDDSIEEQDRLTNEFQHQYECPNPECRHFLGMQPYHVLSRYDNCPYCKCKYKK